MSDHSEALIKKIIDYIIKGVLAITAWFAISFFSDMKQSSGDMKTKIESVASDIHTIKEKMIHLDDKVDYHDQQIKELKVIRK